MTLEKKKRVSEFANGESAYFWGWYKDLRSPFFKQMTKVKANQVAKRWYPALANFRNEAVFCVGGF